MLLNKEKSKSLSTRLTTVLTIALFPGILALIDVWRQLAIFNESETIHEHYLLSEGSKTNLIGKEVKS